jgi:hypothetical protein
VPGSVARPMPSGGYLSSIQWHSKKPPTTCGRLSSKSELNGTAPQIRF